MRPNSPDYPSRRYQETILVLYALEILGSIRSKPETLRYIRSQGWLAVSPQDAKSYDGLNEPKSDTLLCFGRKDAVVAGWMFDHDENDHWEVTRDGRSYVESEKRSFEAQKQKVNQCFMWTAKFKRIFDRNYKPSEKDWIVPERGERHGGVSNLARKYT